MTYSEKLKDPRWQKKRLEVMQSADFACEMCKAKESTLHVHHVNYLKGAKPWDYERSELVCLCEGCHKKVENNIYLARRICAAVNAEHLWPILWYIERAYHEAASVGAKHMVAETLSIALRRVMADTIIQSISTMVQNGESFKTHEFEERLCSYLAGGEVEK